MAQSPASLQEPSMDELLASIREIIEESSAKTEAEEPFPVDSLGKDQANNVSTRDASEGDGLTQATLPIHEAMKALAERIGLKKQATLQEAATKDAPSLSPFASLQTASLPVQPVALSPLASSSSFSATPNQAGSVVAPKTASTEKLSPSNPVDMLAPATQAGVAQVSTQMPLSLSVQANVQPLAVQKPPSSKKQLKPQIMSPTPTAASLMKEPARQSLPVGHIPLYPQFRAVAPQQKARAVKDGEEAHKTPPSQQPISSGRKQDSRRELSDLEQGFLAEFEQSAELLLRPYIAGWLEEHFQNLFEKILREEIQRLMQKNLHR